MHPSQSGSSKAKGITRILPRALSPVEIFRHLLSQTKDPDEQQRLKKTIKTLQEQERHGVH